MLTQLKNWMIKRQIKNILKRIEKRQKFAEWNKNKIKTLKLELEVLNKREE